MTNVGDFDLGKVVHIAEGIIDIPGSEKYICVSHGEFASCVPQKKGAKSCLLNKNRLGYPLNYYREIS